MEQTEIEELQNLRLIDSKKEIQIAMGKFSVKKYNDTIDHLELAIASLKKYENLNQKSLIEKTKLEQLGKTTYT